MWPLLKVFVLKHYTANNIQSVIHTQMYKIYCDSKGRVLDFSQNQKHNLTRAAVSQGCQDQFSFTFSKSVAFV